MDLYDDVVAVMKNLIHFITFDEKKEKTSHKTFTTLPAIKAKALLKAFVILTDSVKYINRLYSTNIKFKADDALYTLSLAISPQKPHYNAIYKHRTKCNNKF